MVGFQGGAGFGNGHQKHLQRPALAIAYLLGLKEQLVHHRIQVLCVQVVAAKENPGHPQPVFPGPVFTGEAVVEHLAPQVGAPYPAEDHRIVLAAYLLAKVRQLLEQLLGIGVAFLGDRAAG